MGATLKQIAEETGVSIYTVSRVLNGKQKGAYRPAAERARKIREVADRLGFVPNASARTMRRKGTHLVGVLVPEWPMTSLVDYETILGINQGLEEKGYALALTRCSDLEANHNAKEDDNGKNNDKNNGDEKDKNTPAPQHPSLVFQERILDGMVVLGCIPPAMAQLVEKITPACLWVDTDRQAETNCLRRDESAAGKLTSTQLRDRGYRRFIYITPQYPKAENHNQAQPHFSFEDREKAIARVAKRAKIAFSSMSLKLDGQSLSPLLAPLQDELTPDTALIASTDRLAFSLLTRAASLGLRPGHDFGLAACDRTHHTQWHWPDLSAVDVRRYALGKQAASMMLQILENDEHTCPSEKVSWKWHEGATAPAQT